MVVIGCYCTSMALSWNAENTDITRVERHDAICWSGITLFQAEKFPNSACPVSCCYAEIQDHHDGKIEAYFVSLVSDMYDSGHV